MMSPNPAHDHGLIFPLVQVQLMVGYLMLHVMLNVTLYLHILCQVYPAVEYDFAPNSLEMSENDLIHFQWTGSNTHNNGNPGGDGQTGDAGEGKGGKIMV